MEHNRTFKSMNDSPRPTKRRDTFSADFLEDKTPSFRTNIFNPFKTKSLPTKKNPNFKD